MGTRDFSSEESMIRCNDCDKKRDLTQSFYCTDCETTACASCFIRSHKSHEYLDYTIYIEQKWKLLAKNLAEIENGLPSTHHTTGGLVILQESEQMAEQLDALKNELTENRISQQLKTLSHSVLSAPIDHIIQMDRQLSLLELRLGAIEEGVDAVIETGMELDNRIKSGRATACKKMKHRRTTMPIRTLSSVLLKRIFSFLSPIGLCQVSSTCRVFRKTVLSKDLWKQHTVVDMKDIMTELNLKLTESDLKRCCSAFEKIGSICAPDLKKLVLRFWSKINNQESILKKVLSDNPKVTWLEVYSHHQSREDLLFHIFTPLSQFGGNIQTLLLNIAGSSMEDCGKTDIETYETSTMNAVARCKQLKNLYMSGLQLMNPEDFHLLFQNCSKIERLGAYAFPTRPFELSYLSDLLHLTVYCQGLGITDFYEHPDEWIDVIFKSCPNLIALGIFHRLLSHQPFGDSEFHKVITKGVRLKRLCIIGAPYCTREVVDVLISRPVNASPIKILFCDCPFVKTDVVTSKVSGDIQLVFIKDTQQSEWRQAVNDFYWGTGRFK